jgi:hypothetical protein
VELKIGPDRNGEEAEHRVIESHAVELKLHALGGQGLR